MSHQAVLRALYGYFMNQPLEVRHLLGLPPTAGRQALVQSQRERSCSCRQVRSAVATAPQTPQLAPLLLPPLMPFICLLERRALVLHLCCSPCRAPASSCTLQFSWCPRLLPLVTFLCAPLPAAVRAPH